MTTRSAVRVRHLTGARAVAPVAVGAVLAYLGVRSAGFAVTGAEGWALGAVATVFLVAAGVVIGTLPWRLTSRIEPDGVSVGWALGRVRVPWTEVRRVVIGSLGTGGQRDPFTVTLLLRSGAEILYTTLGRDDPASDPATLALADAARAAGVRVDNTLASPEEIEKRMRQWREARVKGWR